MKIKEAINKLEEEGLDIKNDKAIFKLSDGVLEIYFDEDENTMKVELHDMNVFVSDELCNREVESVMYELAGVNEEDKSND
ncbi:hypothetical protein [Staphylococcus simulans]|uniref:Phage protein n=1 Tax=Staphylococcus simulans UMC-CNS-990 TaxID=1405498 RepID=A0ABN0PC23_STASI|nr:hypothetical protein [Staphylococcus simulans]ERS93116.1 hypothetical protein SSIM_07455 [Staphylococcus simulans UMC-CNS-990]